MAGIFDKFLNSMKIYDEDDDDDYDEDDIEEEVERAPRKSPFHRAPKEEASAAVAAPAESQASVRTIRRPTRDNVVSMKKSPMEVCMIRPTTLDDAREVCDALLEGRAVVINMEGVHVDLAQRIIDFTSGACFAVKGNLQKISKYIFIVSPESIGLTGDFNDIVEGSQDLSALNLNF